MSRPHDRLTFDPTGLSLSGVYPAQLAIGVLGVLVVSSEYATGQIRATLGATPQRGTLLAAKTAVFTAVVFVIGLVTCFVAFFIGQAFFSTKHAEAALSDPGALRAVIGEALPGRHWHPGHRVGRHLAPNRGRVSPPSSACCWCCPSWWASCLRRGAMTSTSSSLAWPDGASSTWCGPATACRRGLASRCCASTRPWRWRSTPCCSSGATSELDAIGADGVDHGHALGFEQVDLAHGGPLAASVGVISQLAEQPAPRFAPGGLDRPEPARNYGQFYGQLSLAARTPTLCCTASRLSSCL